MADGIEAVIVGLGRAVEVVGLLHNDIAAIEGGLAALGWEPPPGVDLAELMTLDVADVVAALRALIDSTPKERSDAATMATRLEAIGAAVAKVAVQIADLAADLPAKLAAGGTWAAEADIAAQLPRRLLDLLIMRQTRTGAPLLHSVLKLAGVFTADYQQADPAIHQVAHVHAAVHWERLTMLVTTPDQLMRTVYGWGTAAFDAERLLGRIAEVLERLGGRGRLRRMEPWLETALTGSPAPAEAAANPNPQLVMEVLSTASLNVTLSLHRQRASQVAGTDAGLELVPFVVGGNALDIPLGGLVALQMEAEAELHGGVALGLRPNAAPTLRAGVGSGKPGSLSARFGLGLRVGGPAPALPLLLLRLGDGGRLDVQQIRVLGGAGLDASGVDAFVRIELEALRLVIGNAAADGFVGSKLPADGGGVGLDLSLLWSQRQGLRIEGAASIESVISVNADLGFIRVASIRLALSKASGTASGQPVPLRLEIAVTGGLALGPVAVSVDDVGIRGLLRPGQGNLGPLGLETSFKPPKGLGVSIAAGPVTGGGYVFFDPENEQYAGVLQLSFKAISLTAIGLLTTQLPDGAGGTRKGFSLLIIIAAEFPPIQLGYGFTLNGVGGLLGVNRTMVTDVLRAGVRDGSVNAILFPQDPVARAPQRVSQLRSIFPPAEGRYVFGPMVKIGWGPNSLLELEAALVLELLAPVRLVVLGRIRLGLPDKKSPVLRLQLDVVGVIDFDRGEVSIDASLVDSKIAGFTLTGDMALRAGWGATPGFALAAGGFHPRFQSPPGFPDLRRLAIAIADSDNPRLRLESYLALTSNSVQFGALLDVFAKADTFAGTFSVSANVGFDTLIQFVPFQLSAELGASVDISRNGKPILHAAFHATLTGPGPWHAVGYAEFHCLGKHRIDVELTAGPPDQPPVVRLSATGVLAELAKAFTAAEAWLALPPADADRVVTVRGQATGGGVPVHPLGSVRAHQRLLPLGLTVNRFGTSDVDPVAFTVQGVRIGGSSAPTPARGDVYDDFAPGLFTALTDDERLARPAFESMRSGIFAPTPGFRAPAGAAAAGVAADGGYQEALVDTEPATGVRAATTVAGTGASLPAGYIGHLSHGGAAAHAEVRTGGAADFQGPDHRVTLAAERWTVTEADTLRTVAGAAPVSCAEAHDRRRAQAPADKPAVVALTAEVG